MTVNTKHLIEKIAIVIGVLIIPLMYSFFYLNAFWDPYQRLDEVPVAVVNLDQGAVINGTYRNLGGEICDNLAEDGTLDFIFTDEQDAASGVAGTKYYASITIPADFSARAATVSQDTEKLHGTIIYQANQKKNYLAAQILENAMPTIKDTVNAKIDEQIVATMSEEVSEVPASLGTLNNGLGQLNAGSATLAQGTDRLAVGSAALSQGMDALYAKVPELQQGANALNAGAGSLQQGLGTLQQNSPALLAGGNRLQQGAGALNTGLTQYTAGVAAAGQGADALAAGINQYTAGVDQAAQGAAALNAGLQQTAAGVDQLTEQVAASKAQLDAQASDETLNALAGGAAQVASGTAAFESNYNQALALLNQAQATGDEATLQQAVAAFNQLGGQLPQLSAGADQVNNGVSQMTSAMAGVRDNTGALLGGLQQVQGAFGNASDTTSLLGGANALDQGLGTLSSSNPTLTEGAGALQSGLSTMQSASPALLQGASALGQGSADLNKGLAAYTGGVDQAAHGAGQLAAGTGALAAKVPELVNGVTALDQGAAQLTLGAAALDDGADALHQGLVTANEGVTAAIATAGEKLAVLDGLADYAAEPVNTETEYVQPVANYGSAFAPYFMGLSLWVGGLMIYFGIYLDYDRKIKILSKDSPRVILRTLFFGLLSAAQGILLGLVIQNVLKISVAHPLMLYLSCILVAMAFMAVIQFCIVNLGDIGKFVAMLLLILQLTSCAGTFPIETQSAFFRIINPWLPMTYSTQLFKEALAGTWGTNAMHSAAALAVWLVGFVSLTLLFSHKAIAEDMKDGAKRMHHRFNGEHTPA